MMKGRQRCVQCRQPRAPATGKLCQPRVRHLPMSLDTLVGNVFESKAVIPENVARMVGDLSECAPGCAGARIVGDGHVHTQQSAFGDETRCKLIWGAGSEPAMGASMVFMAG